MGKIGDLWVRLGLKSDDYKKGMKDAKKETTTFSQNLGKMKATAIAVWAAVGTAVVKFAKDLIVSTNRMGDAWATFTSQSKAAWGTFLSSVSSWDFDNFFARMREATAEAAEYAKAMDSEFEVGNSIKLQRAAMAAELAALKVQMQDATKTFDERIQAAQNYINKVTPIYAQIEAQAKRMEDAHLGKWLAGTGLTDSEQVRSDLRKFLVEIGKNAELYDDLAALSSAQRTIDKGANAFGSNYGKLNAAYTERGKLYGKLKDAMAQYATPLLDLFRVYNDMRGDKDTAPLVEAMVNAGEAASLKDRETQEMQSVMNGLINQRATAALNKAAKEASLLEGVLDWEMDDLEDVQIVMPEIDLSALDAADEKIKQFVDDWQKEQQEIAQLNGMLSDAIVSSISNGVQGFTDMLVGLEGADAKGILTALMQPFADTAGQLGAMLLAQGIAVEAFQKSLATLQGAPAIAAGLSLMAISAAMKSGIQALAGGGAGAGSAASYGGTSYSGAEAMNYESTLTIYVEGKVSGSDILLAGSNQQKKWNR